MVAQPVLFPCSFKLQVLLLPQQITKRGIMYV